MTTPVPASPGTIQGRVVTPSATANAQQSAYFALGDILKALVHGVPSAFPKENDVLAAFATIEKFVKANVTGSAIKALATGDERAPVEDVSKRPAPAGVSYSIPASGAGAIDYEKLAAYIVREMASQSAIPSAPAQNTEVTYDGNPES